MNSPTQWPPRGNIMPVAVSASPKAGLGDWCPSWTRREKKPETWPLSISAWKPESSRRVKAAPTFSAKSVPSNRSSRSPRRPTPSHPNTQPKPSGWLAKRFRTNWARKCLTGPPRTFASGCAKSVLSTTAKASPTSAKSTETFCSNSQKRCSATTLACAMRYCGSVSCGNWQI